MQFVSKSEFNQNLVAIKTDMKLLELAKEKLAYKCSVSNNSRCEPKDKCQDHRGPKK